MKESKRKILLSVGGDNVKDCEKKIEEVKQRKIGEISLFLHHFPLNERKEIYKNIKETSVEKIPLVHIGESFSKNELKFLFEKYKTRYFTIHEEDFNFLYKWEEFRNHLFLEMGTDNVVADNVKVEKIGGFCVDLAHYQKQKDRKTVDFEYVYARRDNKKLFKCNHLSGYCPREMDDLHYVKSEKDFEYIKILPDFIFSNVIALEISNSIKEQIDFRGYIEKLLENRNL